MAILYRNMTQWHFLLLGQNRDVDQALKSVSTKNVQGIEPIFMAI